VPKRLGYGQVPSHDGDPRTRSIRAGLWQQRGHRSLAGDLFNCQGAIRARQTNALVLIRSSHSRGRRESNPVFGGLGSRPATGASPLCRACFAGRARNQKSRSLAEAALKRSRTCESPVHAVERASVGGNSMDIDWSAPTHDETRVATGPTWPSMNRWFRLHLASLCRMPAQYMDARIFCEERSQQFQQSC
jgi:hypothetical protein